MSLNFGSICNHNESAVFDAVQKAAHQFPELCTDDGSLLTDVVCVALNRLPPHYIRHSADFSFYQTKGERLDINNAVAEAVAHAFSFVQARIATDVRP